MTKRISAPRTKVRVKTPVKVEFTKIQKRLLQTIREKHNQAVQTETQSALSEIYEELGFDLEKTKAKYRLREDLSGLDLVLPKGAIPPGVNISEEEVMKKLEKAQKKQADKEEKSDA